MKKRVFALLVTLALCVCMAVPACAQNGVYVLDELDLLTADEIDTLNSYAASLADELKVDICFVYTTAEDMEDYISQLNLGEFDEQTRTFKNAMGSGSECYNSMVLEYTLDTDIEGGKIILPPDVPLLGVVAL